MTSLRACKAPTLPSRTNLTHIARLLSSGGIAGNGGRRKELLGAGWEFGGQDVAVAVWWDFENCNVPLGIEAYKVGVNIVSGLRTCGFKGPVSIAAYGDTLQLSRTSQEALASTGICLHHVPSGGKDASDRALLVDLLLWTFEHPPPAHLFLISGDRDFSNALHRLRMMNYNILLACPAGCIVSPALLGAASHVWQWNCLVRGEGLLSANSSGDTGSSGGGAPPSARPSVAKSPTNFSRGVDGVVAVPSVDLGGQSHPLSAATALHGKVDLGSQPSQAAAAALHGKDSEKPKVSADGSAGEDAKEPTVRPVPKDVLQTFRNILASHPNGIMLGDLQGYIFNEKLYFDKDFYGHRKIVPFLLSLPDIVQVERVLNKDNRSSTYLLKSSSPRSLLKKQGSQVTAVDVADVKKVVQKKTEESQTLPLKKLETSPKAAKLPGKDSERLKMSSEGSTKQDPGIQRAQKEEISTTQILPAKKPEATYKASSLVGFLWGKFRRWRGQITPESDSPSAQQDSRLSADGNKAKSGDLDTSRVPVESKKSDPKSAKGTVLAGPTSDAGLAERVPVRKDQLTANGDQVVGVPVEVAVGGSGKEVTLIKQLKENSRQTWMKWLFGETRNESLPELKETSPMSKSTAPPRDQDFSDFDQITWKELLSKRQRPSPTSANGEPFWTFQPAKEKSKSGVSTTEQQQVSYKAPQATKERSKDEALTTKESKLDIDRSCKTPQPANEKAKDEALTTEEQKVRHDRSYAVKSCEDLSVSRSSASVATLPAAPTKIGASQVSDRVTKSGGGINGHNFKLQAVELPAGGDERQDGHPADPATQLIKSMKQKEIPDLDGLTVKGQKVNIFPNGYLQQSKLMDELSVKPLVGSPPPENDCAQMKCDSEMRSSENEAAAAVWAQSSMFGEIPASYPSLEKFQEWVLRLLKDATGTSDGTQQLGFDLSLVKPNFEKEFKARLEPKLYGFIRLQDLLASTKSVRVSWPTNDKCVVHLLKEGEAFEQEVNAESKMSVGKENLWPQMYHDCKALVRELMVDYPDGFPGIKLKPLFMSRFLYPLDHRNVGYQRMSDLLRLMPDVVSISGNLLVPSSELYQKSKSEVIGGDKVDSSEVKGLLSRNVVDNVDSSAVKALLSQNVGNNADNSAVKALFSLNVGDEIESSEVKALLSINIEDEVDSSEVKAPFSRSIEDSIDNGEVGVPFSRNGEDSIDNKEVNAKISRKEGDSVSVEPKSLLEPTASVSSDSVDSIDEKVLFSRNVQDNVDDDAVRVPIPQFGGYSTDNDKVNANISRKGGDSVSVKPNLTVFDSSHCWVDAVKEESGSSLPLEDVRQSTQEKRQGFESQLESDIIASEQLSVRKPVGAQLPVLNSQRVLTPQGRLNLRQWWSINKRF